MSRRQPRRVSAFVQQKLWDVLVNGVHVDQIWAKYRAGALQEAFNNWGTDGLTVEKAGEVH